MLQAIRRNSEHHLALVNDVLDLSKIEADRMEIATPTDVPGEVAKDVVGEMLNRGRRPSSSRSGGRSRTHSPDGVAARPDPVRQVLLNLVGNAIKFTDEGGASWCATTGAA